jgi:hypothetical protein
MGACDSIRARVNRDILKRSSMVHLQGIGDVNGIPAEELKAGDVSLWNYCYTGYRIDSVTERAKTCIDIMHTDLETGIQYPRTLKRGRLVAVDKATYQRYLERSAK